MKKKEIIEKMIKEIEDLPSTYELDEDLLFRTTKKEILDIIKKYLVSKPVMTGMTKAERKEQVKNCGHMWGSKIKGRGFGEYHQMCIFCGCMKTTKVK